MPRGLILASDGTVLARSVGRGRGENRTYTRTYPRAGTFAHPVGYSYITTAAAESSSTGTTS